MPKLNEMVIFSLIGIAYTEIQLHLSFKDL